MCGAHAAVARWPAVVGAAGIVRRAPRPRDKRACAHEQSTQREGRVAGHNGGGGGPSSWAEPAAAHGGGRGAGRASGGRAGLGEGCGRAFRTRPNRPSRARVAWQNQGGRGGRGGERRERASAHEGCAQAGGGCGAGRAGGGASHLTRGPRVGTRSRTTPGGLRGAVPPLPCHGESNTRPLGTNWPPGGPSQQVHVTAQVGSNIKASNGAALF